MTQGKRETLRDLDPTYDDYCPCAQWRDRGVLVQVHCWRVCLDCRYSGIHVSGDVPKATLRKAAARALRALRPWWYQADWEIQYKRM